ncbi:PTS N-acetylmuramic acid transporter subunit IIBC [Orbus wheelerorum]|uniref:PTS N-acetylmuramic acid transporter subunit IIBC n=1 Tax=Orbus wheelerorum TaxID=3074111 RepID=UPI00370DDEB6
MSKINQEMINKIIVAVGGSNNIARNGNCMTRLRLGLHDRHLADHSKLKQIDGVMGVIDGDDQLQIILGPGKAQKAQELMAIALQTNDGLVDEQSPQSLDEVAKAQKSQLKSKQNSLIQGFFAKFATIFTPLIPGFIAAGLLLGIATVLEQNFVIGVKEHSSFLVDSINYTKVFSKGLFTFLGILVGYNAQQAFGGTGVNGAILASLFVLTYNSTGTVGYYSGMHDFFGFAIDARGNIIGILIATILGAKVERFIRRFVPDNFDMLLTSTITLLIMGAVTYLAIMPMGAYLFDGMSFLFKHLNSNPIGAAILAGLFLIAVMFGIHQGFVPVYIALVADQGFNSLFPILAMAGGGQVGAAIALFIRSPKGSLLRKQISGAIIPGFLGIGEPLIYGVTLPRIKPFITACIGGAAGGFFIGLVAMLGLPMGLNSVFGPSGVIAIPFMTSHDGALPAMLVYLVGLAITYVAGFIITYFFGSKNVDLR